MSPPTIFPSHKKPNPQKLFSVPKSKHITLHPLCPATPTKPPPHPTCGKHDGEVLGLGSFFSFFFFLFLLFFPFHWVSIPFFFFFSSSKSSLLLMSKLLLLLLLSLLVVAAAMAVVFVLGFWKRKILDSLINYWIAIWLYCRSGKSMKISIMVGLIKICVNMDEEKSREK